MLRVVNNMKNNSAFISTAILSAIFEENKQDNISLLIPFVIKIIHDDKAVTKGIIVEKMRKEYAFYDMPLAIIDIIINRLKKQGIIIQKNNMFEFVVDPTNMVKEFDNRYEKSKKQIDKIINELLNYFKNNTDIKMNYTDCKNSFAMFLDRNGYLLYEDINNSMRIKNNIDKISYHIGRFINYHKELSDDTYTCLLNVIEGSLIANALYVNIDSDNSADLHRLTCYFDAPFMLRVLDFKLPEENKSAMELVKMLKKLNVKIKCFKHNFNEIENILEEFIKNYGNKPEKTLENLVIKNYSETDLRSLLNNLDEVFKNLEIDIVETPEYDKKKYKYVIDEKKLEENLIAVYKDININRKTIEIDVKSVSAIMRLREGKEYRKLEDCNALFITMNKDIRNETNKLLNIDSKFKISPVISDIDLTAIIWLKSLINNKNIPEMKLTENAMAALKPTTAIRKKINQTISNLKTDKYNVTPNSLSNLLCSNYFVENLMLNVDGDPKKISPNILINTYEDTLKQNELLNENGKKLSFENEELTRKLLEKEENDRQYKNNITKKYNEKEKKVTKIIEKIELVIRIIFCLYLCWISYKYSFDKENGIIFKGILIILTVYVVLCNFIPVSIFMIFYKIEKKINNIIFIKINKYYTSKAEKEIEYIFNKTDK